MYIWICCGLFQIGANNREIIFNCVYYLLCEKECIVLHFIDTNSNSFNVKMAVVGLSQILLTVQRKCRQITFLHKMVVECYVSSNEVIHLKLGYQCPDHSDHYAYSNWTTTKVGR